MQPTTTESPASEKYAKDRSAASHMLAPVRHLTKLSVSSCRFVLNYGCLRFETKLTSFFINYVYQFILKSTFYPDTHWLNVTRFIQLGIFVESTNTQWTHFYCLSRRQCICLDLWILSVHLSLWSEFRISLLKNFRKTMRRAYVGQNFSGDLDAGIFHSSFIYRYKGIELHYVFDSRWSDRRVTLHVNRVGHEHENSQGP